MDLFLHYKTRVLTFVEVRTPGVYHCCDNTLRGMDRIQDTFLEEMGVDRQTALQDFNMAPCVLAETWLCFVSFTVRFWERVLPTSPQFFFLVPPVPDAHAAVNAVTRSSCGTLGGSHLSEQTRRSILGLVGCTMCCPNPWLTLLV